MFVITADQVGSRIGPDIVGTTRQRLDTVYGEHLLAPIGRAGGDELQLLLADAGRTLDVVLDLTREQRWSVGVGVGAVRAPVPSAVAAATGPAFYAARDAVTAAKHRPQRFALAVDDDATVSVRARADDADSLVTLLLVLRERRSDAGWELYDLVRDGLPQNRAAERLGISPAAVSARAKAASLRAELDAAPALARLLEDLGRAADDAEGAS